jgi:hypothetical protein
VLLGAPDELVLDARERRVGVSGGPQAAGEEGSGRGRLRAQSLLRQTVSKFSVRAYSATSAK